MKPTKAEYFLIEGESLLLSRYWMEKAKEWLTLADTTPCLFKRKIFCICGNKCLDKQEAFLELARTYRKLGAEC